MVSRWPKVPSGHLQGQQRSCRFNLWPTQTENNIHSLRKHSAHCACSGSKFFFFWRWWWWDYRACRRWAHWGRYLTPVNWNMNLSPRRARYLEVAPRDKWDVLSDLQDPCRECHPPHSTSPPQALLQKRLPLNSERMQWFQFSTHASLGIMRAATAQSGKLHM